MTFINFLNKKIKKLKNRFDVQKAPNILQKDIDTIDYLNKI